MTGRAQRRAGQRAMRKHLRRLGCRCVPDVDDPGRDGSDCFVVHDVGCPFGDQVQALRRKGIGMVVVGPNTPRCGR